MSDDIDRPPCEKASMIKALKNESILCLLTAVVSLFLSVTNLFPLGIQQDLFPAE